MLVRGWSHATVKIRQRDSRRKQVYSSFKDRGSSRSDDVAFCDFEGALKRKQQARFDRAERDRRDSVSRKPRNWSFTSVPGTRVDTVLIFTSAHGNVPDARARGSLISIARFASSRGMIHLPPLAATWFGAHPGPPPSFMLTSRPATETRLKLRNTHRVYDARNGHRADAETNIGRDPAGILSSKQTIPRPQKRSPNSVVVAVANSTSRFIED